MTRIISGNWKMNGSKAMIDHWFEDFFLKVKQFESTNTIDKDKIPLVLICVPDIFIEYAMLKANIYNKTSKYFKVHIGAQDVHQDDNGAFTGNTSPLFLKEVNCKYTIVGHSERRQFQHEDNDMVSKKAKSALNHNITPLVCVGEDLATREANKYLDVVGKQVIQSTEGLDLNLAIIAYEPIWAIGTGKVPTLDEINEMIVFIKNTLHADKVKVLYGGSVKSSNAADILKLPPCDGVLVGGASMKGAEFFDIARCGIGV